MKGIRINWITTLAGLGAILTVVGPALVKLTDNDAATVPDWNLVVAGVVAGLGMIFSRDYNKSSRASGVKSGH